MNHNEIKLHFKSLGIDTYNEPVIYIRKDCHICQSEGFAVHTRVQVHLNNKSLIATLNTVDDTLLQHDEISLSNYAANLLHAMPGDEIKISHSKPVDSVSYIRSKIYGNSLTAKQMNSIINDLVLGRLSDIEITMFLTASAGKGLNENETLALTRAMVETGQKLSWPSTLVVDKHCVGGLPGNRTTLIIVPIVTSFGLTMPKTSSRAITSPAGTADTMEVFAPVNLDTETIKRVVQEQNGCIAWGGAISLSPADDLLIKIERAMDLDSEGQLIASILSKKIAAGSNHLVIDMPVGKTAKIRSIEQAEIIKNYLEDIAKKFSITVNVLITDGSQPVGRGIGPALEAKDVLAVLSGDPNAPTDLRDRALMLAGQLLEFSPTVAKGSGKSIATAILDSGQALEKFKAICLAQGGYFAIPEAAYTHTVKATKNGKITEIDNRHIAQIAKLAGAPTLKTAGVALLVKLNETVKIDQPLFVIHAEAIGGLKYALSFFKLGHTIIQIEDTHGE
jgi:thymidine phosphorylase